ncbi:MAG: cycK, partial [Gemmatimonadetes bacterium]|nr:cycK [Gemmatimonadota bacterium]
ANADIYINLMAFDERGASATLRVLVEPLVSWIWLGGAIVVFGAGIASWPRRSRATGLADAGVRVREPARPLSPLGASAMAAHGAQSADPTGAD